MSKDKRNSLSDREAFFDFINLLEDFAYATLDGDENKANKLWVRLYDTPYTEEVVIKEKNEFPK